MRLAWVLALVLAAIAVIGPGPTAQAAVDPDAPPSVPHWPGWDIARDMALRADDTSGVVLDGWGGLHPFGGAAKPSGGPYWPQWDIARGMALRADGSSGLIVDGWGGLHAFGGAPKPSGGPYWQQWDIAVDVAYVPGSSTAGVVLDGWGGLHAFGGYEVPAGGPYWPGWHIAREVVILPGGSGGYVMDAWGGTHAFGTAPEAQGAMYSPGQDRVRGLAVSADGSGGWVLDATQALHMFYVAPRAFGVEQIVTGLNVPWDLTFLPDGSALFTERNPPRIKRIAPGANAQIDPGDVVTQVTADLSDVLTTGVESGLMGVVADADFSDREIYTCYSHDTGGSQDVRVVRWQLSPDFTQATTKEVVVDGIPADSPSIHHGCRLRFGPEGALWITTGDGAGGTAPQDLGSLAGKTLRIDKDTGAGWPENPFSGSADANQRRVYTFGHRNPQGLALRPGTTQMWGAEHGPDKDDEVNLLQAGGNYGWNPVPGYNQAVPMTDTAEFPGAILPTWKSGSPTLAPSGITFVTGSAWKVWDGALVVAMLKSQRLMLMTITPAGALVAAVATFQDEAGRLRTPVQGPDGRLYVTTSNGSNSDRILRLTPQWY
ncbi:MAG: PQQ-dependent sugar dehydrogenase [Acidimicrobiia bacterium]|nr:PQQ-dependent sugar dehydrogenase [Acidimicrobiia bacterium]